MTYVWEQYLFHYISEGGFTYLVMADDSAERFVFLAYYKPFGFSYCFPAQEDAICIFNRSPTEGTISSRVLLHTKMNNKNLLIFYLKKK